MTDNRRVEAGLASLDFALVEARARRMRAEATAQLFGDLFRWIAARLRSVSITRRASKTPA